ncbi:hypothetical protein Q5794_28455 (plasmid) [Priestia megaterium]|uniref:hypothetical protein n=1 Tax=Priestia megaterium TaxID=1404 RepID=UPI0035BE8C9D
MRQKVINYRNVSKSMVFEIVLILKSTNKKNPVLLPRIKLMLSCVYKRESLLKGLQARFFRNYCKDEGFKSMSSKQREQLVDKIKKDPEKFKQSGSYQRWRKDQLIN